MKTLTLTIIAGFVLFALNAEAQPSRAALLAGHAPAHVQSPQARHGYGTAHRRHEPAAVTRHAGSRIAQAKHDKAHHYAQSAVQQVREAQRLGYRSGHPRWSTRYQEHYYWALDRHPDRLHRENHKRAAELRELRHHAYNKRYGYGY